MPTVVELPGNVEVEFPDGITGDDITRVISTFDPSGVGYDYATASRLATENPLTISKPDQYIGDEIYNPGAFEAWVWHPELNDYRKHGSSRDPETGMVLKGRSHDTYDKALMGDRALGYDHIEGPGGRYFSIKPDEQQQDPIGLAIRNRFGQFEVGGPLGGNAGALDTMFDMAPIIGDYRAGKRAEEASKPQLTPNLLGGATAGVKDPYTLAFESATMLPVMGDVAAVAKAGVGLAPMLGMMARQSDPVAGSIAQALRGQRGLIGYHGSPHKFSKFDHSMMGSGEGAQAYGWGTYIAERPGTARTYINPEGSYKRLSGHLEPKVEMAYDFLENGYTDSDTLFKMQDYYADQADFDEIWGAIKEAQKQGAGTGNLYEVDLPDERIAQMLDWDAPLSEQPESVQKAVKENVFPMLFGKRRWDAIKDDPMTGTNITGEQIYHRIEEFITGTQTRAPHTQRHASEKLRELGIPGIKYWDGGSRSAGSGTRNFVVFDEKDMTILKRNDEVLKQLDETISPQKLRTSDGYSFYLLDDGRLVDNLDPDSVDMEFGSMEEFVSEFEELPLPEGKNEIAEKAAQKFHGDWAEFMREPDDYAKYLQALNKQNRGKVLPFKN